MKTVIEIRELRKTFGDFIAVNGISFSVNQGEVFGLLGPNGAGKSTIMKMMYCSAKPTSGEVYILGLNQKKDAPRIKTRIGVVPQEDSLDGEFTVKENLLVQGSYYLLDPIVAQRKSEELLRVVKLERESHQMIYALSGGMKRRLSIARGLMNTPEIVFLDEPTTGLDPHARLWIWDFLNQLKAEMNTVVLTTHYMEEAEKICDRIAIVDQGKILTIGTPATLIKDHVGVDVVEIDVDRKEMGYWMARAKEKNLNYMALGKTLFLHFDEKQNPSEILNLVGGARFTLRRATLNDVFLKLTGKNIDSNVAPGDEGSAGAGNNERESSGEGVIAE